MGRSAALLLCAGLVGFLVRADDFDLSDALDNRDPSTPAPKKPSGGDSFDFDLSDAIGGGSDPAPAPPRQPEPRPDPKPQPPPSSGGFSDSDLADVAGGHGSRGGPGGGNPQQDGEAQDEQPQGVIPGIVGAVVVAVAGAISSFIAYQKKKLCFKENQQGEANLERASQEPPVQQTLLER